MQPMLSHKKMIEVNIWLNFKAATDKAIEVIMR